MRDDADFSQVDAGVDVTADSPLPDVPDAGADSLPIVPPEPVDISTATLTTDASLVATTFGDPRTMYEQALDAYDNSSSNNSTANTVDQTTVEATTVTRRHARIYDGN